MANWVRINKALLPESIDRDKQTVFAYVDGSYDDIGVYGSGCVLLSTENIILEEITSPFSCIQVKGTINPAFEA